jgi:hypothetical protein
MVQSAIQGQDNRTAWFVVTLHETQYSVSKTLSIQSMEAVESIPQPSRIFGLPQTFVFGTTEKASNTNLQGISRSLRGFSVLRNSRN